MLELSQVAQFGLFPECQAHARVKTEGPLGWPRSLCSSAPTVTDLWDRVVEKNHLVAGVCTDCCTSWEE